MKKNIFKKMIVSILSLSLMFSFSAPVAAASHAPNGSDIISKSFKWTSILAWRIPWTVWGRKESDTTE